MKFLEVALLESLQIKREREPCLASYSTLRHLHGKLWPEKVTLAADRAAWLSGLPRAGYST